MWCRSGVRAKLVLHAVQHLFTGNSFFVRPGGNTAMNYQYALNNGLLPKN